MPRECPACLGDIKESFLVEAQQTKGMEGVSRGSRICQGQGRGRGITELLEGSGQEGEECGPIKAPPAGPEPEAVEVDETDPLSSPVSQEV